MPAQYPSPREALIAALQAIQDSLEMLVFLGGGGGGGGGGTVNQGNPNTMANAWPVILSDTVNPLGTAGHPLRVDPTGTTPQPISAASLPLPTGAATEATLATRATEATLLAIKADIEARLGVLGQALMAGSTPVVIASDQSRLPVHTEYIADFDLDSLLTPPLSLIGIALPGHGGPVIGGTLAAPVRVDPTGDTPQPITVSILPLPLGAATEATLATRAADATLTGGSAKTIIRGGTKGATTPADITSTAEGADHQAADVQIYHAGVAVNPASIRALTNADVVSAEITKWLGSTAPTVGQKVEAASIPVVVASDQSPIPVSGSFTFSGGAVDQGNPAVIADAWPVLVTDGTFVLGTAAHPVRNDPTGTTPQPITATSLPLPTGAATEATLATRAADATLTGGTAKAIIRGGAKGATVAADVTSTAEGADHQAVDVQIYHGGTAINPASIRALTNADVVTTEISKWIGSAAPTVGQKTSANSLPVVVASDQSAIPVSVASLPLPTGAATEATLATRAADATLTGGTAKAIIRGGAKGATVAADVTGTAEGADHQAVDVQIYHGGTAINPASIRALTNADIVTAEVSKWLGSTAPTVGQKTLTNSLPVAIASDQPALLSLPDPNVHKFIAGTVVTASGSFTLSGIGGKDVILIVTAVGNATGTSPTLGFRMVEVDPGTLTIETSQAPVSGPSPPEALAADGAYLTLKLDNCVSSAVKIDWTVAGAGASFPAIHATLLAKAAAITRAADGSEPAIAVSSDGTFPFVTTGGFGSGVLALGKNLAGTPQPLSFYDLWSGGSEEWVLGINLRGTGAGGSIEIGTATNPIRTDPTNATETEVRSAGSQVASETSMSSAAGHLAVIDGNLSGGSYRVTRGGVKGATAAADITGTAEGVDHQALDVQIYHAGVAKDPTQIRALASGTDSVSAVVTGSALPTGAATEATLALIKAKTDNLDVALSTRATEATLATLATQATLAAAAASLVAIDTGTPAALGQTTASASMPVVLASDQVIAVSGTDGHGTTQAVRADLEQDGAYALRVRDDTLARAINEQTFLLLGIMELMKKFALG